MTESELNILIDRYFDGDATAAEEALLRRALEGSPWRSAKADEARAVMAYSAMAHRKAQPGVRRHKSAFIYKVAGIAACVALMASVSILFKPRADYGFANGERITTSEQAMLLMNDDFAALAQASSTVEADIVADLSLFNDVINN